MTMTMGNSTGNALELHDVLIIGAGPCGLAVAARLREANPSALYTDEEHARYHWLRQRSASRSSVLPTKRNGSSLKLKQRVGLSTPAESVARSAEPAKWSVKVVDATSGQWCAKWNTLFKTFDIKHLRSPMFFHVDPKDRDALVAFAHARGTKEDVVEIPNCVGKEISKHQRKKRLRNIQSREANVNERDRQDYFTPSQSLFQAHCKDVQASYGLSALDLSHHAVHDIDFDYVAGVSEVSKVFTVRTSGSVFHARAVVLAIGAGGVPCIPNEDCCCNPDRSAASVSTHCCHSMQIKHFPSPEVVSKQKSGQRTRLLIVGGGLTSAQLADLAIRRGVSEVVLIMRGACKVKHFDVDLEWMGKFSVAEQAKFWIADTDEERFEMIRSARGGGSITPKYQKILQGHIKLGQLQLHRHTTISSRTFHSDRQTWEVSLLSSSPTEKGIETAFTLPAIDYIYYATGVQSDFASLPFLQTLLKQHPIHGHGGLPCLTTDLAWAPDVPLFVTGRLAGLRLGPAAGNLGGARAGAERIALAIEDLLGSRQLAEAERGDATCARQDHARGISNQYELLGVEVS